jgi:hypothetical protein
LPLSPIGFSSFAAFDLEETLCLCGRTMLYYTQGRNLNQEIRAGMFKFQRHEFFEVEAAGIRTAPTISAQAH